MKITELKHNFKPMLAEAKARIDHPEDLVFTEGPKGAMRALNMMVELVKNPKTVSIKWDGSPALIFGRDEKGFVLTDKSGFGAKGYDGMPRDPMALKNMLLQRRPGEQGREEYSTQIAALWPYLEALVPRDFKGYLQGDLLWVGSPPLQNGAFQFKPNKIQYSIPQKSTLGEKMGDSKAGIVIHSFLASQQDAEAQAINIAGLGLHRVQGLVVVSPQMPVEVKFAAPKMEIDGLKRHIQANNKAMGEVLNPSALAGLKLTTLPQLFTGYLSYRAGKGLHGLDGAPRDFFVWLSNGSAKISQERATKVIEYIKQHSAGYNALWQTADALVKLKDNLRIQLDNQAKGQVGATLNGTVGHEGFVAATPKGTMKLVNRSSFMAKQ